MGRHLYHLTLYFEGKYIADPYLPEREELINVQKGSGMNRARSEQKRQQALSDYLKRIDWTPERYAELEQAANQPWYRQELGNPESPIIIPSHQYYGCLIETCKNISAVLRPCDANNLRYVLRVSDLTTERCCEVGVYKRLVMPKSVTGQPLSNQRALRSNPYIDNFSASGTIAYDDAQLSHAGETLEEFLSWAGQFTGVGAARKMGCGRFVVQSFVDEMPKAAAAAPKKASGRRAS